MVELNSRGRTTRKLPAERRLHGVQGKQPERRRQSRRLQIQTLRGFQCDNAVDITTLLRSRYL
jgi:hypothetical protein